MWNKSPALTTPLLAFLQKREKECVMAGEIVRDKGLYLVHQNDLEPTLCNGLAALKSNGNLAILLPENSTHDEQLALLLAFLTKRAITKIIGPQAEVQRIAPLLWKEDVSVQEFILMEHCLLTSQQTRTIQIHPMRIARPSLADMESLIKLHQRYEQEELGIADLQGTFSEHYIRHILSKQMILAALVGSEIVGKINTNARGFYSAQIGGFYVKPEYRGHGIGRALLESLTAKIFRRAKKPVLFVRPENREACRLYERCGFIESGKLGLAIHGTQKG